MSCFTAKQFEGASFASATAYPFKLAEAQGMIVGDKYVIYGGFKDAWITPTAATHTLDLTNPAATWQRDDDIPQPTGLTHGAHIHVGNKLYNCGGYVGPHPGVHTTQCIVYDSSMPPGARWTTMTPMPVGHGKGGGGMFYNTALNAMYYISGAQRFISASGSLTTRDLNSTFMYSFNNPTDGWVRKADLPYGDYGANHMMAVTARDGTGAERHYGFGGQRREEEPNGNYDHVFEYNAQTDVWTRRAKMLWPLAHASSSTIPFGCGFIVVAGNTNGAKITSNITFYNTETDSWTQIGNLPTTTNTPVCDIHRPTSTLFCETGKLWTTQSYKRRIVIP